MFTMAPVAVPASLAGLVTLALLAPLILRTGSSPSESVAEEKSEVLAARHGRTYELEAAVLAGSEMIGARREVNHRARHPSTTSRQSLTPI